MDSFIPETQGLFGIDLDYPAIDLEITMTDMMAATVQRGYDNSLRLAQEAQQYLAGGVSSNFRLSEKPVPLFFDQANGSHLRSVDGVIYIDYALGMGPAILGHADPDVNKAVSDCLSRGQLYAGQHEDELRLAKVIREIVPCAELIRFSVSGSEAIQGALRLARAYTSRKKIIKFEGHYHGWFDNIYASVRPKISSRTPQPESEGQNANALLDMIVLPWNDLDALADALDGDVAGVIMEPVMCNTCVIFPDKGYLEGVRELCDKNGTLLIFDEVITGFRLSLTGAQGRLNVTPDLAVFAKAFANGFPGSCLAGCEKVMALAGSGRVMHGGTYNSNIVGSVAAIATIDKLRNPRTYETITARGNELMEGLRQAAHDAGVPFLIQGCGAVFHTAFTSQEAIRSYRDYLDTDTAKQSVFLETLLEEGVRTTRRGTWFLSASHTTEDIEETLRAARVAFKRTKNN